MSDKEKHSPTRGLSLAEAMHLQALEGNPLDADQVAMFETFEREGWPEERRRAHIHQRILERVGVPAAE